MKRELIALVAHEINRAYCASLGDDSQPAWADAPEWQLQIALAGVDMHLANPDATPEQSHASWLEQKLADGWAYGEVKDAEKKLHPCCRPYEELPPEQKSKDYLFRGVVHALKDLPDGDAERILELQGQLDQAKAALIQLSQSGRLAIDGASSIPVGQIGVQYVGRRPDFTDRVYGTGLTFVQGQVRPLPLATARQFLRHPDQFAEAEIGAAVTDSPANDQQDDTAEILARANLVEKKKREEQSNLQDVRDQVTYMTSKDALATFALTKYQQKLDKRGSIDDLRAQVLQMVDQFGAL